MRFLLDQDVYLSTERYLATLGHDIVVVAHLGLSRAADEQLLRVAHEQNRVFVTRDRDFGSLVFVRGLRPGVIYLRMLPSTLDAVHRELARVLGLYSEQDLVQAFVVITADGHRIRRLPRE